MKRSLIPKRVLMLAILIAAVPSASRATTSPAAAFAFWCAAAPSPAALAGAPPAIDLSKPASLFCAGRYADAVDAYIDVLPYWRAHQTDGKNWLIAARGYFVSLLALGRIADAQHFLASLGGGDAHLSQGDRLFIEGKLKEAFAWFAGHADSSEGGPGEPPDTTITDAATAMQGGDLGAALEALQRKSSASGSSSNSSEQKLMLGDFYAAKHQWNDAFAAWSAAANSGHAVPDFDTFDLYNLSALEMIYYFRGHIPESAPS